jgi:FkbM family methyltransferase
MATLNDLLGTVALTRDWPSFVLHRLVGANRNLTTFRLRNGQAIRIHNDQAFVLNEIYRDRVYDVPGVDLAACRNIADLGANVGVFALYASSKSPNAMIHCFEPAAATFAELQGNLRANRVNAVAHQAAISVIRGSARLYHAGTAAEWSLNGGSGGLCEEVDCIDLTSLLNLVEHVPIDFMKVDVEGAELEVMANATDRQLRLIGALSVEWHHSLEKAEPLLRRLRQIGFEAELEVLDGNVRYLKAAQKGVSALGRRGRHPVR